MKQPATAPLVLIMASALAVAPQGGAALAQGATSPTSAGLSSAAATSAPAPTPPGSSVQEIPLVVTPPRDTGLAAMVAPQEAPDGAVLADEPVPGGRVTTEPIDLGPHQTVGLTWRPGSAGDLDVQLRSRTGDAWGPWIPLEQADEAPDDGTADAVRAAGARAATDPVWLGDAAQAVQLSFSASPTDVPDDVSLLLVGSPDDATAEPAPLAGEAGVAALQAPGDAQIAASPGRRIISRAEWGAPAQVCTPDVASTLTHVVLHHTAGSNAYSTVGQAMQQLRNDALYHINGRGWCDIGYNFVVDKWGNIYEGRAGSADRPVIGVHAGGFNTRSLGISMLGTYGTVAPSAAVQDSVAWLAGWRLAPYNRDPGGHVTITTPGGENTRYPAGSTVTLPVVFGHRDVGLTACPGNSGYATLPWIRERARSLIQPGIVDPTLSTRTPAIGTTLGISAATLGTVDWSMTIVDDRTGIEVHRANGRAAGSLSTSWNLRAPQGTPVGPGAYRLTMTATRSGAPVQGWTTRFEVTGGQTPPTVQPVPLGADLTFVPVTPQRVADTRPAAAALGARSRMDVVVAGVAGVPADAAAVALNVTAVHASSMTHLRVWPAGRSMPAASVLNTDPARTVAGHVVVGVGGERKVSLYNDTGSVHLAVDVSGYYVRSGGSLYSPSATAARVLDTRASGPRLTNGGSRTVPVAGQHGVPADATAVVVNVTSVAASADGYVVAVPAGAPAPSASTVNHRRGGDASNRATVPLAGGALDVRLVGGAADVVVDVVGWYGPSSGARFTPIAPVRAFDTRSGTPRPFGAGESRDVAVRGPAGLPVDAVGVVAVLTATQQTAPRTFVTAWDGVGAMPGTSDLNTGAGRDEANLTMLRWSPAGSVRIYNNLGSTHLVADVFGYFR